MYRRMLFATSGLLMVGLLLVLSPASTQLSHAVAGPIAGSGEHAGHVDLLSAAVVGPFAAGEKGRLPVRWGGGDSGGLSARVDFDGDDSCLDAGTPTRFRGDEARAGAESRLAQERACAASLGKSAAGCGWASGFWISGLDSRVDALAVYDDGSGAALYAGGGFTTAGGVTVNSIAKWDGTAWSALSGPSGTGTDGSVLALAVYDDGSGAALYAGGGWFTTAGGVTVNGIAKWDGTAWSALSGPAGTGTNDGVFALAAYDDGNGEALYAGGYFTTAGGIASSRIGRWSCVPPLFADGFESGDTSAWSTTVGGP